MNKPDGMTFKERVVNHAVWVTLVFSIAAASVAWAACLKLCVTPKDNIIKSQEVEITKLNAQLKGNVPREIQNKEINTQIDLFQYYLILKCERDFTDWCIKYENGEHVPSQDEIASILKTYRNESRGKLLSLSSTFSEAQVENTYSDDAFGNDINFLYTLVNNEEYSLADKIQKFRVLANKRSMDAQKRYRELLRTKKSENVEITR